jgi:hypothetical protein
MLTQADDYPIHQTAEPIAYSGTDRNFYDRYFFNGYSRDGSLFFAAALGVYPHLNIMDAAFCVVIDGVQHNLHASRHLHMERMDTRVGPIAIEVLQPLHRLRVTVDDAERGLKAELVFESRAPVVEEPRFTRRVGPRVFMDYTRMTQVGGYSGWIEVGGRRVDVAGAMGTRDRSWGIRPVGLPDPQALEPAMFAQFYWVWSTLNFDDCHTLYMLNADEHGEAWNTSALIGPVGDSAPEHMKTCRSQLSIPPGTRHATSAQLFFGHRDGSESRIDLRVHWQFYMTGLGYFSPEWAHGLNKGPLATGYDSFRTDAISTYAPPYAHVQAFVTATLHSPDGRQREGRGVLEQLILGPYAPLGLTGFSDPVQPPG